MVPERCVMHVVCTTLSLNGNAKWNNDPSDQKPWRSGLETWTRLRNLPANIGSSYPGDLGRRAASLLHET